MRAASSLPAAPHLAYISIVGVDRLSFKYFRSKLESERIVTDSGLPWTILRATQLASISKPTIAYRREQHPVRS